MQRSLLSMFYSAGPEKMLCVCPAAQDEARQASNTQLPVAAAAAATQTAPTVAQITLLSISVSRADGKCILYTKRQYRVMPPHASVEQHKIGSAHPYALYSVYVL